MKSLLLLSCVVLVGACGSSSGTRLDGVQTPPPPSNGAQTPQQPSDSVPPVNSQLAPINPQLPPLGGTSTQTAVTCDQVAAAARAAGCNVNAAKLSDCVAGTALGAACGTEWQALLACLVKKVVCGDNGDVNNGDSCPNESDALDRCLTPVAQTCRSPSCSNCRDTCTQCECTAVTTSNLDCTTICAIAN